MDSKALLVVFGMALGGGTTATVQSFAQASVADTFDEVAASHGVAVRAWKGKDGAWQATPIYSVPSKLTDGVPVQVEAPPIAVSATGVACLQLIFSDGVGPAAPTGKLRAAAK